MDSILLVDDNDDFRAMLSQVLTRAGYHVQEAADGQQAIDLYERHPVDLVIADLVMPGKDGLEMIRELKQRYPEGKIIAFSGGGRRGSEDYLKMAQNLGAQRVLAKPFSDREILEVVRQVLKE